MNNVFEQTVRQLVTAGIASPRLEARLLIAHVLKCDTTKVFSDVELSAAQNEALQILLQQRLHHKPMDKILGHREFYKADFMISEDVLSPRPDTEILVEKVLQLLSDDDFDILDLGTGSGCIIESVLAERPKAHGVAVDISEKSLDIALQNAEKLQLGKRIRFIKADWFASDFLQQIGKKFTAVVTNPPYIPTDDIEHLDAEVRNYDPLAALDGGTDGFASYMRIAELAPDLLKSGGYIFIEAGIGQAEQIAAIFEQSGLSHVCTVADLNGIARCVILQKAVAKAKKS